MGKDVKILLVGEEYITRLMVINLKRSGYNQVKSVSTFDQAKETMTMTGLSDVVMLFPSDNLEKWELFQQWLKHLFPNTLVILDENHAAGCRSRQRQAKNPDCLTLGPPPFNPLEVIWKMQKSLKEISPQENLVTKGKVIELAQGLKRHECGNCDLSDEERAEIMGWNKALDCLIDNLHGQRRIL